MQQPGISGNRMGSSSHDRSMKRLSRCLACLSLVLCLPSFAGAGAARHSDEDGKSIDSARIEKAVAGLKETEQALFLYERIERVEERRSSNDTRAADVQIFRVFPAGTGTAHIPLGPDLAPANAEGYRSELEKLLNSLTWAAQSGKPQRDAYERVAEKQKERAALIDQTRSAFFFTLLGEESRG